MKAHCPGCARLVDASFRPGHGNARPNDGDYTVCIYCVAVSRFRLEDDELTLVLLSDDDWIELPAELRTELKRIGDAIRRVQAASKHKV